jgi:hypothetical protein
LYKSAADAELPPPEDELPLDEEPLEDPPLEDPPPEFAAQANPTGTAKHMVNATA